VKTPPKVGDKIYVSTSIYLSHGIDDFRGGWAIVSRVTREYGSIFVEIEERPGHGYNWKFLGDEQKELAKEYGDQHAEPDPDNAPESNRWD